MTSHKRVQHTDTSDNPIQYLKSKIDDCYPFFEEKAADFRKRDDDEVDKHNKVTEEIFNRKNEVKDAVTKEALALVEVMKSIWDTDSNPVKSERERLCQVFKVDFPEINGLVSLNEDICVMFNKDDRRFKYFTISDFKFITVKNDIKDVSTKERYGSVKIFDITNYKEEILVSDDTFQLRRLKNDGTFQKVAPSITIDQLSFYGIHAVK
ncbi:unnamed protein product [Mytilus edulis]|uniref:Uncharacterized protein n=1 Tax=Mytilus edulis TaxID=6550 RepID=A0A8S3TNZ4_MYTED|nr:unnamed protein product [Mytilus edulis]